MGMKVSKKLKKISILRKCTSYLFTAAAKIPMLVSLGGIEE